MTADTPRSADTRKLRPIEPWWTPRAGARFRRQQLEQYALRVRPFLVAGVVLLPLGALFDFSVTHAGRPPAMRLVPLVLCLLLAAICGGAAIALRRAEGTQRTASIARGTDLLLTGLGALYLSGRVMSLGGVYAHVTAAASLTSVLFIRTLVMPSTWGRAALTGVLVWLAYPLAWLGYGWLAGERPAVQDDAVGMVAGTVVLFFIFSVTVTSLGAQMLLGLRRTQFQAAEARRYHIERKLGGGGMGDIYLAWHGTLKMQCAIKVCRCGPEGIGRDMLRRFEKEAQQVSRLQHPNVVRIFDYGEMEDGSVYYAMEHLPGMDLGEFLRREGPPAEARLLRWADQILFALQEAHSQGIIHRDLKPANIFLTCLGGEPDVIKLLDFGLVKIIEDRSDDKDRITRAHAITGTPLYMSPEQAQGLDSLDHRSDLYSLGVVLYELACGHPPFLAADPMNVLVQHVTVAPRPLRELSPSLSVEVESAIHRLLAKKPGERFADARAAHVALRESPHHAGWDREQALRWWADRPPIAEGEPAADATTTTTLDKGR